MSSEDDDLGLSPRHAFRGLTQQVGVLACVFSHMSDPGPTPVIVSAIGLLLVWVPFFLPNQPRYRSAKALPYFCAGFSALVFALILLRALGVDIVPECLGSSANQSLQTDG